MTRPPIRGFGPKRRALLLFWLAVPFVAHLAVGAMAQGVAAPAPAPAPVPSASASAAPASPEVVSVGFYLQKIPEIDIKTNTLTAEFYLWFLWSGASDPTLTFQLANALDAATLTKTPVETNAPGKAAAEVLPGGRHYEVFHVYGRFSHPFPLAKYPFDDHEVAVSVEDSNYRATALLYRVDAQGYALRHDLTIPGGALGAMRYAVGLAHFGA